MSDIITEHGPQHPDADTPVDPGFDPTVFARLVDQFGDFIVRWAIRKGFREACENCDGCGRETFLNKGEGHVCPHCKGTRCQPDSRNFAEQIMLVVTECAELVEGHRCGAMDKPDKHCPQFTNGEIEVADAMIRLMDLAAAYKMRLGAAIVAKMAFNQTRPPKHGKRY